MGIRSALRNPDWLAELHAVLTVAMVVAVMAVAVVAGRAAFGDSITVSVGSGSVDGTSDVRGSLQPNAAVDPDGVVDIRVTDPSAGHRAWSALTELPSLLVGLAILALLWGTVRTARRAETFSPTVVRHLRRLGVVALAGGVLAETIQLVATFFASEAAFNGFLSASYRYSWWWLLVGFGFLAIAEVVKRGTAMRVELDTLV